MAFWDSLKTKTQEMNTQLTTKAGQFKNKEFANGSMAMCALIAAADGSIDPQRAAQDRGADHAATTCWRCSRRTSCSRSSTGTAASWPATSSSARSRPSPPSASSKSKPEQARAVIQIGIIIGGADGNFDAQERAAVKEACIAVGIAPAEFDL